MTIGQPVLRPAPGESHTWELLEPLAFSAPGVGAIRVYPGARTDGASIPRPLWTLVGPPLRDTRVVAAAIIHDQLYCTAGLHGQLSRRECDQIFHAALLAGGCPRHRAALYYAGVRTGGWIGWMRYARNPERISRELALIGLDRGDA